MADKTIGSALTVRWPLPAELAVLSVKDIVLGMLKLIRKQYNRPDIWIHSILVTERSLDGLSFIEGNRTVHLNAFSASLMPDGYMEIYFVLPEPT